MIKILLFITSAQIIFFTGNAQNLPVEKLKEKLYRHRQPDTSRVNLLNELARRTEIFPSLRDSLLHEAIQLSRRTAYTAGEAIALTVKAQFAEMSLATAISGQAVLLAQKSNDKKILFRAYRSLGQSMLNTSESIRAINPFRQALQVAVSTGDPALIISGQLAFVDYYKSVVINYPVALEWSLKALQTAEQFHTLQELPVVYRNIGAVYLLLGDQEKSLVNLQKALVASRETGDNQTAQFTLNDIGENHRGTGRYPEALKAYSEAALLIKDPFNIELNQSNVADVYQRMGNDSLCFAYAFRALAGARQLKDTIGIAWIDNILSRAYLHAGRVDSAVFYGRQGYQYAVQTQALEFKQNNSEALANAYTAGRQFDKALYYYKIYISLRDSMLNNEVTNKTQLAQYNYDLQKKQTEITVLNKNRQLQQEQVERQRFQLIGTIAVLVLILASVIILYRNNLRRKKAYAELQKQKQEIQVQRDQTSQVLHELKLAQSQLVQSEKMASLGELTAGIAHEIQNPLNFVNNFSEVNTELIDELEQEADKGNMEEVKAIAKDIKENEQKINHHGKRADAIVKGMLQHSRSSSGQKEPTDINGLADEYLRLAYHGLRAKDKSFNATLKTDYDETIGSINIIPQDIGRVMLNLITNAFYTVSEKKKCNAAFEPTVTVGTKNMADKTEISVADNGSGIPQSIVDKIFQPFFTTKPTGQGTGLGLSLAYDIVKAHGGELKVETTEGQGSEFIISLPA